MTVMKFSISIIIPFHNRRELLPRMFDSLLTIDRKDVEVVLVDNNSDEATKACVAEFADRCRRDCPFETVVALEPKSGAAAARNRGLDIARGDYVYFFDSDDELTAKMLSQALDLARRKNADVVALRTQMMLPDGSCKTKKLCRYKSPRNQLVSNNLATQSLFMRRSFAMHHARWNERLFYWNDLEWAFRVLLANPRMAELKGRYHKIYIHPDSITGRSFSGRIDKILVAHDAIACDIESCTDCTTKQKHPLLRALNCRKALYAGYICREGDKEASGQLLNTLDARVFTFFHRRKLNLLFFLAKRGIPGVWRLA